MRVLDTDARQLVHFVLGLPLLCGPAVASLLGSAILSATATVSLMLAGIVLTSAGTARDPRGDRLRADSQRALDNVAVLLVLLLTLATCLPGNVLPGLLLAGAGAVSALASLVTDYSTASPHVAAAAAARTRPPAAAKLRAGARPARPRVGFATGQGHGERP